MVGRDRRLAACHALQILLYESRAEMNVHLDERAIPDDFEAVNLAGLDDENVPSATFKRLSVHGPYSAAFPDKLDLIVGMPVRPRTLARQPAEQKHGDAHVSLLGREDALPNSGTKNSQKTARSIGVVSTEKKKRRSKRRCGPGLAPARTTCTRTQSTWQSVALLIT